MHKIYGLYEYGISLNQIKKLVEKELSLEDFIHQTEHIHEIQKTKPKLYSDIMHALLNLEDEKINNSPAQLAHEGLSMTIIDNLIQLNIRYQDIESLTLEQYNEMNGANKNSVFSKIRSAYESLELNKGVIPYSMVSKIVKNIIDTFNLNDVMTMEELEKSIPYTLENGTLARILNELEAKKAIRFDEQNRIKKVFPKLDEYLQKDFDDKKILLDFLEGKPVSDLAKSYQYSRQGIYNILKRIVDKMPRFEEVYKYSEVFEKFNIGQSLFCKLFNEPSYIYMFLELVLTKGNKSLLDDLFNNRYTEGQRRMILEQYNCFIDKHSEVKELSKMNIFETVVEQYALLPVRDKDLVDRYNEYIAKQNLPPSLMSDETSIRGLGDRSKIIIRGNSHTYRYYNYDIITQDVILTLSSLLQLETGVYSMKKIFNENPSLMEAIDIKTEYELHNLYKQMVPLEHVTYTRMPEFVIGNISKKAFLLRLFHEYSPVHIDEFLEFLEELWGIRADSTRSFIFSNLNEYLDGDIIKTDYISLSNEELKKLSIQLDKPLYTVDEMICYGVKVISNFEDYYINNMTLSKLGYTLRNNYILSNDYNSLDQYYRELILSKDYFYNNHLPIYSTKTFWSVMYDLEKNYDILKVEKDVYMTYSKFIQAGMSKLDIDNFKQEILSMVEENQYFTLYSLRQNGFEHYLENLGFSDIFYERIIWCFDEIRSIQTATGYVYKITDTKFSLGDFLYDYILRERIIDIYDLLEKIHYLYGLTLEKSKVLYILRDTDVFYSEELYKLYADKEDYYEEVFEK
ncbi:hypothetical protein [Bacillus sp. B15-48]|uniref:hypothetical protein n=1 Tax=Bacillus sp. B15-48 TaxID=1548601 RepID=UPI00193FA2E3|nr:hypothetical protein [Bacillus sp. B15-48]MBM4765111.1 hypothetical protein [Bacillus sp. B15-48]